jgi:hypothetical protein
MTKTKIQKLKLTIQSFGINFAKEPTASKLFKGKQLKFYNRGKLRHSHQLTKSITVKKLHIFT